MCQLLETIKCLDGKLINLKWHQQRFDLSRKEVFGKTGKISLSESLRIPPEISQGLYRCRVTYSTEIELIEFLKHQYRPVTSLALIDGNDLDYHLKFKDRSKLDQLFDMRGNCDDILIVKNGWITDSYTANPVFFDGRHWITPHTVLLEGTQRAKLLKEKKIFKASVSLSDLDKYIKTGLINAMQDLTVMPLIEMDALKLPG